MTASAMTASAMTGRAGDAGDRGRGETGSGVVAMITLVFAFTFLGLVSLSRDVDRSVSNRSTAQSVAFQAARSGAQAALVPSLRQGSPVIDEAAARRAATATASALFESYGVSGTITSITVAADQVTVAVTITDGGRVVTGLGAVRAERTQ
jgi:hypothetical protein